MATQGVSLQDALTNVRCLENLALPDEQPTIEPEPASVVYEVSFDTNFADRTAFITGIGKYNEEATVCSNLVRRLIAWSAYCVERKGRRRERVEGWRIVWGLCMGGCWAEGFMRHAIALACSCMRAPFVVGT